MNSSLITAVVAALVSSVAASLEAHNIHLDPGSQAAVTGIVVGLIVGIAHKIDSKLNPVKPAAEKAP